MIKKILGLFVALGFPSAALATGWDWEFGFLDIRWSSEELAWVQETLPSHPSYSEIRAFVAPPNTQQHCSPDGCDDPDELMNNYVRYLFGLKPGDPLPDVPEYPLNCTTNCIY